MSLKRDMEELKKGNIRYADQLAAAGGVLAGNKLSAAGGKMLFKNVAERRRNAIANTGDAVTADNAAKFRKALDKVKKRDPSLKVAVGSLPVFDSITDELNKKYDTKIKNSKSKFMKEYYSARKAIEERMMRSGGAHYSPNAHTIRLPKSMATEAILEHEAGHATKDFAKKFLQKGRTPMALAGTVTALKSAMTADRAYKGKGKKRADDYRKARNEAALSAGLIAAPTLAEEARATGYALKRMKGKRMKALKQLAPAYATYVGKLGAPAAAPIAALEYYRRKHSKGLKNGNTRR